MTDGQLPNRAVRAGAPRWWRISQGVVVSTLTAVGCGVVLWAALAPIMDFGPALIASWALVILAAVWIALATIGWIRFRTFRSSLIAPSLGLLTTVLVLTSVPFWVGFHLSSGRLETIARDCTLSGEDRRVGVYEVNSVTPVGDAGCRFATQGGLVRSVGLAYLPDGVPPDLVRSDSGGLEFEHLTGDWFRYYRDF